MLAIISDLIFHWNATQSITCAAIFTCISVAAGDLIHLGGKKPVNLIISFIASAIFILLYIGMFIGATIVFVNI